MKTGTVKRRDSWSAPAKTSRASHSGLAFTDSRAWTLPSGMALAEFALQSGFLASLLMKGEGVPPPFFAGPPAPKES